MGTATSRGYSIFAETLVDLPYVDVAEAAQRGAAVLLPTGVVEEHGPHLPLGVDIYGSYILARLTRDELSGLGHEAVIAPPFYWGINHVTSGFTGSFRTRPEVARELLIDIGTSLADDGFETLYIVNHHGDAKHAAVILEALSELRRRGTINACWVADEQVIHRFRGPTDDNCWLPFTTPDERCAAKASDVLGVHAQDTETAMMLGWFPGLVETQRLEQLPPTSLTANDLTEWRRGGEHAARITPDGYFGDPRPGSFNLWRRYILQARGMATAIQAALVDQNRTESGYTTMLSDPGSGNCT